MAKKNLQRQFTVLPLLFFGNYYYNSGWTLRQLYRIKPSEGYHERGLTQNDYSGPLP